METMCLTEEEVDQKLKIFQGKKHDDKYKEDLKNAGNLFEDEAKEHLSVTKDTYMEVFKRAGGILPFLVLLAVMLFNHGFHTSEEYSYHEWGSTSLED